MEKAGVAKASIGGRLVHLFWRWSEGWRGHSCGATVIFFTGKKPVRLAREVLRQILDKLTKKGMQLENHHTPQICDTLSPQSVAKDLEKQLRTT